MSDAAAHIRAVLDANRYMTLATADGGGRPWASPVFYATADHARFYWISAPDATHSRNLAVRPDVSIVVFDTTVEPGTGGGVYMSATAEEVPDDDLEEGLSVYPGPTARGGRPVVVEDVTPPSPYRLYCARVSEHSVLCPREPGRPCGEHGLLHDHRTVVRL